METPHSVSYDDRKREGNPRHFHEAKRFVCELINQCHKIELIHDMIMTMILTTILLLFLFAGTEAFVLLPRNPSIAGVTVLRSTNYDDVLARLQYEYEDLQDTLIRDLAMHKEVDKEQVAQAILEKAIDVADVQRYKQMEIIDEASKELIHASDDKMRAHALHEQAHAEAMSAEREAALLESIDAGYEDMERLRDLSVAHASHDLENDAEEHELYSSFKELEASAKKEKADILLKLLERNEAQLKDSLKQLRDFHYKKAAEEWVKAKEEWEKAEAPKHDEFLDKIKELMIEMNG
jgi:hypothetical protein